MMFVEGWIAKWSSDPLQNMIQESKRICIVHLVEEPEAHVVVGLLLFVRKVQSWWSEMIGRKGQMYDMKN